MGLGLWLRSILATLGVALIAQSAVGEPLGSRDIRIDPTTDYMVQKFSSRLDDPIAEAIRDAKLLVILTSYCSGVRLRSETWSAFSRMHRKEWRVGTHRESTFLADNNLLGFDGYALQHACVAISYLYGPHGKLIPNAVAIRGRPAMRRSIKNDGYFSATLSR